MLTEYLVWVHLKVLDFDLLYTAGKFISGLHLEHSILLFACMATTDFKMSKPSKKPVKRKSRFASYYYCIRYIFFALQ